MVTVSSIEALRTGLIVNWALMVLASALSAAHEFAAIGRTHSQIRRAVLDDLARSVSSVGFGLFWSAGSAFVGVVPLTPVRFRDHVIFGLGWALIAIGLIAVELTKSRVAPNTAPSMWTLSRILAVPIGVSTSYWVWTGASDSMWPLAVLIVLSLFFISVGAAVIGPRAPAVRTDQIVVVRVKMSELAASLHASDTALDSLLGRLLPGGVPVRSGDNVVIVLRNASLAAGLSAAIELHASEFGAACTIAVDGCVAKARARRKGFVPLWPEATAEVAQTAGGGIWLSKRYLELCRSGASASIRRVTSSRSINIGDGTEREYCAVAIAARKRRENSHASG